MATQSNNLREDHGLSQCIAKFHSIVEMVSALRKAQDSDTGGDNSERQTIEEDALSVEVRGGWYCPSGDGDTGKPVEYCILLCTGGPAVRITGSLSKYGEPETATLQYQDWFTPWQDWHPHNEGSVEAILLAYASCFYFGQD